MKVKAAMRKYIYQCQLCGKITTFELAKGLSVYSPPKHCGNPMQPMKEEAKQLTMKI